ncbi:MAG TPA: hypothetical protein VMD99_07235 [Terriglobales bacterium]|nr:hypothetical protein [Terriglobales bacterium]
MSAMIPSLGALSPALAPAAPPSGRGPKAAREFEAQLIGSLLDSMEKTFAALPGQDSITGSDNYSYLGTHALAEAMADHGGFGLAAMITPYLSGQRAQPGATAHQSKGSPGNGRANSFSPTL